MAAPASPLHAPAWRPRRSDFSGLAGAAESDPLGFGIPAWVEQDFRAYFRCGILAYGFARARCDDCGRERLIAFSCKGRGICPSCNTRRMAEVAAHLTDHVQPHLPVRGHRLRSKWSGAFPTQAPASLSTPQP